MKEFNKTFYLNEMTEVEKKKIIIKAIDEVIKKEYLPKLIENGCTQEELELFIDKTTDKLLNEFFREKWQKLKTAAQEKWDQFFPPSKPKQKPPAATPRIKSSGYYEKVKKAITAMDNYVTENMDNYVTKKEKIKKYYEPQKYIADASHDKKFSEYVISLINNINRHNNQDVLTILETIKTNLSIQPNKKKLTILTESINNLLVAFNIIKIKIQKPTISANNKYYTLINNKFEPSALTYLYNNRQKTIWQQTFDINVEIFKKFLRCLDNILSFNLIYVTEWDLKSIELFTNDDLKQFKDIYIGGSGIYLGSNNKQQNISSFYENKNKVYKNIR